MHANYHLMLLTMAMMSAGPSIWKNTVQFQWPTVVGLVCRVGRFQHAKDSAIYDTSENLVAEKKYGTLAHKKVEKASSPRRKFPRSISRPPSNALAKTTTPAAAYTSVSSETPLTTRTSWKPQGCLSRSRGVLLLATHELAEKLGRTDLRAVHRELPATASQALNPNHAATR